MARIVAQVKAKGLDGITVTEHENKDYAYRVMEIVESFFDNDILIIPGQELRRRLHHIVELYLPGNAVFRFVAHPGHLTNQDCHHLDDIHGVEIENGNRVIDEENVCRFARERGLLLLSNSDAHTNSDIGRHFTEVDVEELCTRTKGETLRGKRAYT